MKSRLVVCDANMASWLAGSSPLTVLMFLYPAACHHGELVLSFAIKIVVGRCVGSRGD